jgi:hypothetical protein
VDLPSFLLNENPSLIYSKNLPRLSTPLAFYRECVGESLTLGNAVKTKRREKADFCRVFSSNPVVLYPVVQGAGVAKLADALDLGSRARKSVGVQVPSPAPSESKQRNHAHGEDIVVG